tara:strand:- start:155 stop:295 length:141 start_codon:yes stop_codon:yes gene_type:complete
LAYFFFIARRRAIFCFMAAEPFFGCGLGRARGARGARVFVDGIEEL